MRKSNRSVLAVAASLSLSAATLAQTPTTPAQAPPAQAAPSPASRVARFPEMSRAAEKQGLAEDFKGITTNGEPVRGLFPVRSTGVSTEPVRVAAEKFLAALTDEQRRKTTFAARRRRMAQVDEPELLRAPGRELQGDDRGAARGRVRTAARVAQRQGPAAEPRHHEAEPHARRAQQRQLRRVRRVAVLDHAYGQAVGERAVGLPARRPPPDRQLLRAGRPGRDDAGVLRLRAHVCGCRQVPRHARDEAGAGRGPRVHEVAHAGATQRRDAAHVEDRATTTSPKRSRTMSCSTTPGFRCAR